MTIRHFRIFLALYEEKNMTAAASKLYISQPSVSQALKEMEEHYETKLFERLSNRLYITEAGLEVFHYASYIIRLASELEEKMKGQGVNRKLSVGANYTIGTFLIHDFIEAFRKTHENILVNVHVNKAANLLEMLRNNSLDFILIEERTVEKDMIQTFFQNDRIVFAVGPEHRLNDKSSYELKELTSEKFLLREKGAGVRDLFNAKMFDQGYQIEPYWESTSTTALIQAAKRNYGIGVFPYELVKEELSNKGLCEITINDLDLSRKLVIAYHKNKFLSEDMKAFMKLIVEYSIN